MKEQETQTQNFTSCDTCGTVLDLSKVPTPNTICPACGNGISRRTKKSSEGKR